MAINPRFIAYFRKTFFDWKEEQFQVFLSSLEKWIPRTIRIKPGKENMVRERIKQYWFLLHETSITNVYELSRSTDFDPLERRIGYTLDHLLWNFYIQELAAATSVSILSGMKIHTDKFLILDMAASPGGKTTQLSEQYPNSFIIANEPTRERIPQLLQNLDRMGSANIGVTLYPGQYFRHTPEVFDRILLDAPCSGEGTLYKWTDATKHWHLKNIKNIATLQTKLLDAAIVALKVGGEMVYSTCSMNLLENEWVLEAILAKYPGNCEVTYQKHFWPHVDGTGGFFVAKITKLQSIDIDIKPRPSVYNESLHAYEKVLQRTLTPGYTLYEHDGKILVLKDNPRLEEIRKVYYFMRFWEKIADKQGNSIVFDAFSHRYVDMSDLPRCEIQDETELDMYLRGAPLEKMREDGPVIMRYQNTDITLEESRNGNISNKFPRDWQRK